MANNYNNNDEPQDYYYYRYPPKHPRPPKPTPQPYVPGEALPVYATYTTQVINGIRYKTYLETDWHQVMTEDGVTLFDLLKNLPILNTDDFYKYRGTLQDRPDMSAMEQLYAMTDQQVGFVYLVETSMVTETGKVCEVYTWLGNDVGWVYHGTTDKKASVDQSLPEVVHAFPDELGEPGQVMVISEDGKSLVWGSSSSTGEIDAAVATHDESPTSHQDIRDELALKADKLVVFNDVIKTSGWNYDDSFPCFEYIYTNDNIPNGSYFEIVPLVNNAEESANISNAGILGVFEIFVSSDTQSYARLRAKRVPEKEINIFVKVLGTFIEN